MSSYVFGPVPSRRLGRSLGVDLVPMKTCTFNCIYCQLGRTATPAAERRAYAPVDEVLRQVREKLDAGATPDFITLAGGGEPTLHAGIADVIAGIKAMTAVPVSVLTNGSLFIASQVRRDCLGADVIMPSLDAGDEETFRRINRPHESFTLARLVEGLEKLRDEYAGKIWLEVFLVEGVNDTAEQCRRIRALSDRVRPDRIDLNTAVRPTTEPGLRPVPPARMEKLRPLFGDIATVIADYAKMAPDAAGVATADAVFAMLDRRPCTLDDIAAGLAANRAEVAKALGVLMAQGRVVPGEQGGKTYYKPAG